jgi:hypothetical protein
MPFLCHAGIFQKTIEFSQAMMASLPATGGHHG